MTVVPSLAAAAGRAGPPGTGTLHVVLVAYTCDPGRGTEPGLGWAWAEALAARGHRVEVLTRAEGDNQRRIADRIHDLGAAGESLRCHFVPLRPPPGWLRAVPKALRGQLAEFLRYARWQDDALRHARSRGLRSADVVHHVTYGSLVGGSALWRLGPPLVLGPVSGGHTAPRTHRRFLGSAWWPELLRSWVWVRGASLRPACRRALRNAAVVLVTNRDTQRLARRLGRRDARLELADGIPDSLLRDSARPPAVHRPAMDAPVVLWVGRLVPLKAPGLALEAFARLRERLPAARLEIVGDGVLRGALEEGVARRGLADAVTFRGRIPWAEALAAYDHADVLLFTSLRDSFGVQALEAWARGLPVVHLDHQGIGDFSAPGGAVPVPLGSPTDLARRLADGLYEALADPERRPARSAAAVDWARRHTWPVKARAAEALYTRVLADTRR